LDEVAREKAIDVETIEIWFQDEARIGQKNKITRRWAKRGTRPSAPRDQRTASTYIFGAVCPKEGKGAALILPTCNTEAMNLHLTEIAQMIATGSPCGALGRSSRVASVSEIGCSRKHHHSPPAVQIAGAQPGRKCLAVHAR